MLNEVVNTINNFFHSNPLSFLILTYAVEKGLDVALQIPRYIHNKNKHETSELANQLVECMKKALEKTCDILGWEYDDSAIADTFVSSIIDFYIIYNQENLTEILSNAVGHPIREQDIECWIYNFIIELSSEEYSHLNEFLKLQKIFMDNSTSSAIENDWNKMIQNRLHFRSDSTRLHGRESEMEWLKEFCLSENPENTIFDFQWWVISGHGGSGKSRLAFELIKLLKSRNWTICVPSSKYEYHLRNLSTQLVTNTIFVLDYSELYSNDIGLWISSLYALDIKFKIRVLLIERKRKTCDELIDHMSRKLGSTTNLYNSLFQRKVDRDTIPPPRKEGLHLGRLDNDAVCQIMCDYIGDSLEPDSDIMLGLVESLTRIDPLMRPLFAMIVADGYTTYVTDPVRNSHPSNWCKLDSLEYVYKKEVQYLGNMVRSLVDNDNVVDALLKATMFSTVYGGIALSDLSNLLPDESKQLKKLLNKNSISRLAQKGMFQLDDDILTIPPIEPDIIGEYFVIKTLQKCSMKEIEFYIGLFRNNLVKYREFVSRLYQDIDHAFIGDRINKTIKTLIIDYSGITKDYSNDLSFEVVIISNGIDQIGNYSFKNCYNLQSVIMDSAVISIGDYAFENCINLREISLSSPLRSIGIGAFRNCKNLQIKEFGDSIDYIGAFAFIGCEALRSVVLPPGLEYIYNNLFNGCKNLERVFMHESVKELHFDAFRECYSLSDITVSSSIKRIPDGTFAETRVERIDLPDIRKK